VAFSAGTIIEKGWLTRAVVDNDDGTVIKAKRIEVNETGTFTKDQFEIAEADRSQWVPVGRMIGHKP